MFSGVGFLGMAEILSDSPLAVIRFRPLDKPDKLSDDNLSDGNPMKHSDIIKDLGGATEIVKLLADAPGGGRVDREAVYKWIKLERIPWKWRPAVMGIARAQGVPLPDDFLPGIETEAAE